MKHGGVREASVESVRLLANIRPAIIYVHEYFSSSITVETLAAKTHFSKSYFLSRFHQAVGMSPMDYVNRVRIREVCRRLMNTSQRITDIAYDCGFRNISNLNRQFEKHMSCMPSEYRAERKTTEKEVF